MGPPPEVDLNPDSGPHSIGGLSYPNCDLILIPELVIEKWSRVNRAYHTQAYSLNEHVLFINGIFTGAKSLYKRGVAQPV